MPDKFKFRESRDAFGRRIIIGERKPNLGETILGGFFLLTLLGMLLGLFFKPLIGILKFSFRHWVLSILLTIL